MTAVEFLESQYNFNKQLFPSDFEQAKEMEKEEKIEFAKIHVKTALKAVENEMILQASSVKYWYLPQNIK